MFLLVSGTNTALFDRAAPALRPALKVVVPGDWLLLTRLGSTLSRTVRMGSAHRVVYTWNSVCNGTCLELPTAVRIDLRLSVVFQLFLALILCSSFTLVLHVFCFDSFPLFLNSNRFHRSCSIG